MMRATICYTLHTPVVYNKGTKYEKSHDTFLECYCANKEMAKIECDKLNKSATDRIYFVSEQEEMY